ncbi:hypothetical protein WG68_17240 [Arsukibacterium ikkense]|uniref:Uncharacterized protein n=1 Tax=Arsukibacterium ikkense TaxID=336831 RepID=A0A0M2V344_9GAMM|nr:hypothetical protein [Arsukibacterium ikkense]KKO44065.1 hypothetical protein WG68_17240 [Arsukibacterium ikkense]
MRRLRCYVVALFWCGLTLLPETVASSHTDAADVSIIGYHQLTGQDLTSLAQQLPETPLQQLKLLQDQLFHSEQLLAVALDTIGFATTDDKTATPFTREQQSRWRQLVYNSSFKAGHWRQHVPTPLSWQATPRCGCAPEIVRQERFTNFSYGLVPYWQSGDSEIAFNAFNRIGLYSFTLGEHNQLQSPPNWRNNQQFNDFINTAQSHNTYLDIVVTAFDRISYHPADLQRLREQLVAELTTPMAGFALNNLQPWLSLGLSSRRTLADGVTFNLDLSSLTVAEQLNFETFLSDLRADLNLPAEASATDTYYINLKIPAKAVLNAALPKEVMALLNKVAVGPGAADTPYSPEKLAELAPLVNLLLVRFDHSIADSVGHSSAAKPDVYQFRREMKLLKTAIDSMANADDATLLLEKILPLFEMAQLQQSGQLTEQDLRNDLTYANWNFSGAAFWTLPLSQAQYDIVYQAFSVPSYGYQQVLLQLCDRVCPKRWFWRLVLAMLLLSVLAVYLLATLFYHPLQRWLEHPVMLYGVPGVFAIGLLLILSCDPYWHQFQSIILIVALALLLLGFILYRRLQQRREHYP